MLAIFLLALGLWCRRLSQRATDMRVQGAQGEVVCPARCQANVVTIR